MAIPADIATRLRRISQRRTRDRTERDRLILEAHQAGASLRDIAGATGGELTHVAVLKIIRNKEQT